MAGILHATIFLNIFCYWVEDGVDTVWRGREGKTRKVNSMQSRLSKQSREWISSSLVFFRFYLYMKLVCKATSFKKISKRLIQLSFKSQPESSHWYLIQSRKLLPGNSKPQAVVNFK